MLSAYGGGRCGRQALWRRCKGFWTYLHIKDAATACRGAIESDGWAGHERVFLNADDAMTTVT